jgi:hypothetical protein
MNNNRRETMKTTATEARMIAAATPEDMMSIVLRGIRDANLRHNNVSCHSDATIEGRRLNSIACLMADSAAARNRGDIEASARLFVEAQSRQFAASVL